MSLRTLIEKGGLQKFATATPATPATPAPQRGRTVAGVATVAVANLPNSRPTVATVAAVAVAHPETPLADSKTVLDTLIAIGTWSTTNQMAEAVHLPAAAVLPVLKGLLEAGSVERDGGPIYIWKAALESRLHRHGCLCMLRFHLDDRNFRGILFL